MVSEIAGGTLPSPWPRLCQHPFRRTHSLIRISLICVLLSIDLEQESVQQHDTTTRERANTWFQYAAGLLVLIKATRAQNSVML